MLRGIFYNAMALITLENASLALGHDALLDRVNLVVEKHDVVALIGRNGAGKSSLLKALAGLIPLDDGRITLSPNMCVAYVAQEPAFVEGKTVFECVAEGLGELTTLLTQYHQITHSLPQAGADMPAKLAQMEEIQHQLEAMNGWRFESLIETTLTRLGLEADRVIDALSGGWKKRVALARALVAEPDVLLLDEPTNHLDIAAIEWLETVLTQFSGSVLLITHDRCFLDRVATRIVELDRGNLRDYPGRFTAYQALKAKEWASEAEQNRVFDALHAKEEVWIRRGIEARRTRNMGRVRRLEALRQQRAQRRDRVGQVNFQLSAGERSGKLVAELEHVSKSFGDKTLIHDFTTRILRGDKIGLVGPNGVGKTTLLKLILGELPPDQGSVRQGSKLQVAYFDQFRCQLDENARVVDVISQGNEFLDMGGTKKHVMSYLEDFLFSPARARSPVHSLSGGERNRLLLARMFTRPANVLVLDEPTNDLDIDTLELLEECIAQYTGSVFLVSHDRAFLDNVVTQLIVFEGNGRLTESLGGYQDWVATCARMAALAPPSPSVKEVTPSSASREKVKPARMRLSYKETRELAALPDEIAALEQEQQQLMEKLLDPECFRTSALVACDWQKRIDEIEAVLLEKLARWEALEARQA